MISFTICPETLSYPKTKFTPDNLIYLIDIYLKKEKKEPSILILSIQDYNELLSYVDQHSDLFYTTEKVKIKIDTFHFTLELIRTHDLSPGDIRIY